jgi:hypothetical protein
METTSPLWATKSAVFRPVSRSHLQLKTEIEGIFPVCIQLHFHVARAGDDVPVAEEAAGAEKAVVAGELADHLGHPRRVAVVQVVDGAHVVHPAAR